MIQLHQAIESLEAVKQKLMALKDKL
jgi:hypothetical protein